MDWDPINWPVVGLAAVIATAIVAYRLVDVMAGCS